MSADQISSNSSSTQSEDDELTFTQCRSCSDHFEYAFPGWTVKIIVGIPKVAVYKAASYLWGDAKPRSIRCVKCNVVTVAPFESVGKFKRLMALTDKSGEYLWLDALSINQNDPEDIASTVAVMGDIYSNAASVAVLLPQPDGEAFELLARLVTLGTLIVNNRGVFSADENLSDSDCEEVGRLCQDFFGLVDKIRLDVHKYAYWSRAWTFQEWALACNTSLAWEGSDEMYNLANLKSCVLYAAVLMCVYKLRNGQYARINIGFSRGLVPSTLETVKRLFPSERAFLPANLIDEKELQLATLMPSMSWGTVLGLRMAATGPQFDDIPLHSSFKLFIPLDGTEAERRRIRIHTALNALSVTKRQARFEADLIASWASMCNISYEYRKDDTFAIALQKVLRVLRKEHGMTIYNFLANTRGSSAEVDLKFLDYAALHRQCNANGNGYFHGLPILTGRADTAIHLMNAISQPLEKPVLQGSGIPLQKVLHTKLSQCPSLRDTEHFIAAIQPAVSGMTDGFQFLPVLNEVVRDLKKVPADQLALKKLAIAAIGLQVPRESSDDAPTANVELHCWAICLAEIDITNAIVAREDLNGTLVLATPLGGGNFEVISYLTVTDQQSGTHLIKVDKDGELNMTFRTPLRSDIVNSVGMDDRTMKGKVALEEKSVIAF